MVSPGHDPSRGVYGISVAAELLGMGSQNLRAYERHGLVEPARTDGGTRRYSSDDLTGCGASVSCFRPGSISPGSPWCSTWRPRTPGYTPH